MKIDRGSTITLNILSSILLLILLINGQTFGFPFGTENVSVFTAKQFLPTDFSAKDKNQFVPTVCPGPGLLISEVLANPNGTDSPFEFVELRATRTINFASTPYSVVVNNNGTATAAGWVSGGALSYGFNITAGTVNAGDVVYVGGSLMAPTGTKLRTINTGTTAGDGFGNAATSGVFGNGGSNADGVAVFDVAIGSLTNSSVPIDAIFYGTGTGTAVVSGGTVGYQLPVNDRYTGGKLQTTSFLAPDPASDQYTVATGTFDLGNCSFTTPRTWANATTLTDGTSSVTLSVPNAPTINENTASPFVNLAATGSGFASGVVGDATDPLQTLGADFTINDVDTPVNSLTVTATSNNSAVVPNANLNLTGSGANRNLKITPIANGYSTITVAVSDGGSTTNYLINYAASVPANTTASTHWHTGKADASSAIAIDSNYMFVADDEDQGLRLYDRDNSGFPLNSFDFTANLALTDISGGIPREVDIEASAQNGTRIYWLGSHSNASSGNNRPNRSRLFATDISGAGSGATLSYVGRYDGLKADLINWDSTNAHGFGANFFGLAASAAVGVIPEAPDGSGFNIEGLVFAPDNSTVYIAFRSPIIPASNRTKALIVPVTNIAALVAGNPSARPATFGAPIQLNLGGRGIREIKKNASNEYLIVAGDAGALGNFATYSWNGNPAVAPVLRSSILTGLNPEAIVEIPVGLNSLIPQATVPVQFLSDNGDNVYYGDGIAAKDLANNELKKFRSDIVSVQAAVPTAANVSVAGSVQSAEGLGIGNARVSVMNATTGAVLSARTNSFGIFTVSELSASETYVFEVRAKQYSFAPQVLNVAEEITDLRFVAEP